MTQEIRVGIKPDLEKALEVRVRGLPPPIKASAGSSTSPDSLASESKATVSPLSNIAGLGRDVECFPLVDVCEVDAGREGDAERPGFSKTNVLCRWD